MMMRALLFGSSTRRGAPGWTDAARIAAFLATALPDVVIEGESPCGGADRLARLAAEAGGIPVDPYPQSDTLDGPRGFLRRNARMHRDGKPDVAAGFVSGKVGTSLSGGSANMARVCLNAGTPLVLYRDNGVEPCRVPLRTMRRLYELSASEMIGAAYLAVNAWRKGAPRDEVLAALACAREGSRWAPWIEAVEAAVRA